MKKNCPRCGKKFECKPDDIFSCECTDIYIPPNLAFQIDSMYNDCICAKCLREMIEEFHKSRGEEKKQYIRSR